MRADPHVLHVMQRWGVPSETFVRSAIRDTPAGRRSVLCHDRDRSVPFAGALVTLEPFVSRVPHRFRGKVSGVVGLALMARTRADVIHSHFGHQLELATALRRASRRPLVASVYGRDLLVELRAEPAGLARLREAQAVIALSRYLAEEAVSFGVDPAKVSVVPLGIDPAEFPEVQRRPRRDQTLRVLFVGRFVEKKGVLEAVDALVKASEAGVEVVARFLGSGPLEQALRDRTASGSGLDDRLTVEAGDRPAVLDAFRWADVVLSPSKTDGDGDRDTLLVVNLEAQAAGVPVVTSAIGGIPESVGPDAGILCAEGDVEALASALVDLAADPGRRLEMGERGRRWVHDERTSLHTGRRIAAVYRAVTAGLPVPSDVPVPGRGVGRSPGGEP